MMRKILAASVAVGFVLSAAAAQAGTLTSATWSASFQGNPFTLTTGGGSLLASGTSVGNDANVTVTVTPQFFSTLDTSGSAPVFISQTLGGSQTIAVNGGVAANQGVGGVVHVFIGTDNTGINLFNVPLSVGVTPTTPNPTNPFFTFTGTVPGLLIPVSVTASAFAWTTGTVTITGLTSGGNPIANFTTAGGNNLTPGGNGTITLVAPSITRVCAGGPFTSFPCNGASQLSTTASATRLTLNFVPEPGTLLLLGAGLAGLAVVGRRARS